MHRISSQSGDFDPEQIVFVDQPPAPILFLSSASTDINTIDEALKTNNCGLNNKIRAITIPEVEHASQIDYYLLNTGKHSKLIIVRLLGGKSYWPYGLEQVRLWKEEDIQREFIILSATEENEKDLHCLNSIDIEIVSKLASLIRSGGIENMSNFLNIIRLIFKKEQIKLKNYNVNNTPDIIKWKWSETGEDSIGVILYNSLFKANDLVLAEDIYQSIVKKGFKSRIVWVKTLKDCTVHAQLAKLYKDQNIKAIITGTSFSSGKDEYSNNTNNVWDILNVPVFQILISTGNYSSWNQSLLGLNPVDLTMQVVMPEIDGRITTRPCAFKETKTTNTKLSTSIKYLKTNKKSLDWVLKHIEAWISLRNKNNSEKKISIILANYPVKNGRLANGVGLDTPKSLLNILNLLVNNGYYLGSTPLPKDSLVLINKILSVRTNDPESQYRPALDYLTLEDYLESWNDINEVSREKIIKRWNTPIEAIDIEPQGFPIHGIVLGNISILIQPSRGYDPDSLSDLHSPDLAPPHRYLAQYQWLYKSFKSDAIIHLGKHGSIEWLPGKGIGLSTQCFPHITLPPLPHIYPFIVNDPGEGSQAKRRTQAVIIDHLTPPLARAGLYGNLLKIEALLDEYYECKILSSSRLDTVKNKILELISQESFPFIKERSELIDMNEQQVENVFTTLESYLCEIKDSQIRTGLHILGEIPTADNLIDLALSIARAPQMEIKGLTQEVAIRFHFCFDPWSDNETEEACSEDKNIFKKITNRIPRLNGEILEFIEKQSYLVVKYWVNDAINVPNNELLSQVHLSVLPLLDSNQIDLIKFLNEKIISNLLLSTESENISIIDALNGKRVVSGPSGAPTRGRVEVLPTGRNFFSVDIRGIPTESAWDLGNRSAMNIIELHQLENGEELSSVAISIWGTSTMRNGGEDIGQILSLMGVQPVWDFSTRRVIDLEIIPLSVLNRPRVEVLIRISGLFRDTFPQIVELLNAAQLKLSCLDEPIELNPYLKSLTSNGQKSRIFGSAPGAYGAGLQEIISSSNWDTKSDLVDSYIEWSKWQYDGPNDPKESKNELIEMLSKIKLVVHNQDNKEHDILDSDDYYQFQGGISAAIEEFSGKKPTILIGDHSRYSRPRISKLEKEIDKVVRSRLLNEKWINGIKKHGYKGAFEIGASVDYLFGYDATTNLVPDWCYRALYKTFLKDTNNLEFLRKNNPWVLRDIGERIIEASNRGLWSNAETQEIDDIKVIVNSSELIIENLYN